MELAKGGRKRSRRKGVSGAVLYAPDYYGRKVYNAMAFQPVPDTVEVTVVYSQNNEPLVNVFHAEKGGGYLLADLVALADDVDSLVATWLLPVMTVDCEYLRTEVRGLAVPNDLFAVDGTNSGFGGNANPGLPNSVTLSLKKGSGLTGRSARGRWYWVGMPAVALSENENIYESTAVSDRVAALEGLRDGIALGDWTPVILSRFANSVARDEGETFDWLTVTAVDDAVDTQRRRLTR